MQGPLFRGSEQQGVVGSQQGKKKKRKLPAARLTSALPSDSGGQVCMSGVKQLQWGGREAGRVTSDLREPDWGIYHSQGQQCSGAGLSIHTHHFLDAKHHP